MLTAAALPQYRRLLASTLVLSAQPLLNNPHFLLLLLLHHPLAELQSKVHRVPRMAWHSDTEARRFSAAARQNAIAHQKRRQ